MKRALLAIAFAVFGVTALTYGNTHFYRATSAPDALDSSRGTTGVPAGEEDKLDATTRELIALAVAVQIPCVYCIYAQTKKARAAGATEVQLREAIATAAQVRRWSAELDDLDYDFDTLKAEIDRKYASN